MGGVQQPSGRSAMANNTIVHGFELSQISVLYIRSEATGRLCPKNGVVDSDNEQVPDGGQSTGAWLPWGHGRDIHILLRIVLNPFSPSSGQPLVVS